jgi:hypothetical protein
VFVRIRISYDRLQCEERANSYLATKWPVDERPEVTNIDGLASLSRSLSKRHLLRALVCKKQSPTKYESWPDSGTRRTWADVVLCCLSSVNKEKKVFGNERRLRDV